MNRRRLVLLLCLLIASALLLASCKPQEATPAASGATGDSTSVAANSTATSAPTVEPTATESVETASLADVPGYRAEFTSEYSMGEEGYSSTTTMAYVADPLAWSMTSDSGDGVTSETRYVDGTMYTRVSDTWTAIVLSPEDAEDYTGLLLEDDLGLDEMDDACDDMGKEVINGFDTRHYSCDAVALDELAAMAGELDDDSAQIKEGTYELWVSEEYGVAIKMIMSMTYEDPDEGTFTWNYSQTILEIGDDVVIEAPEDVESTYDFSGVVSEEFELPVMDGATEFYTMMGMSGYDVVATADEVSEFYMNAMEADGWTYDTTSSAPEYGSYMWTRGTQTTTLMVSEDEGTSSVMLVLDDGSGS